MKKLLIIGASLLSILSASYGYCAAAAAASSGPLDETISSIRVGGEPVASSGPLDETISKIRAGGTSVSLKHALTLQNIKDLACALSGSKVTTLAFRNTEIDDEGIAVVADILQDSCIEIFSLVCNRISDTGAAFLAAALPESSIKTVRFSYTDMTEDGIETLVSGFPHGLKTLRLNNNGITNVTAFAVAEALQKSCITTFVFSEYRSTKFIMTLFKTLLKHNKNHDRRRQLLEWREAFKS